jgi:hypothetical protein
MFAGAASRTAIAVCSITLSSARFSSVVSAVCGSNFKVPRMQRAIVATSASRRHWAMANNYVTSPPSENSRHLTDFQGNSRPACDFGLERREIAAVYAGELTIEEAR